MDEEDEEPAETCGYCGGTGEEGELGLDDDNCCSDCREGAEAQRQLESDYRFWCR